MTDDAVGDDLRAASEADRAKAVMCERKRWVVYHIENFVASDVQRQRQRDQIHVNTERPQGCVGLVYDLVAVQSEPARSSYAIED